MFPGIFDDILGQQLFGYITFRTAMAGLTAFVLALVSGRFTIRWLKSHRVVEDLTKTDLVPKADADPHSKKNTPTMGGSFLVMRILPKVLLPGCFGCGCQRRYILRPLTSGPSARR